MAPTESKLDVDRRLLREAQSGGRVGKLRNYTQLSGPGWMQGALTLGGGSLASSLLLGTLGGFSLLWVQPLAVAVGVVMLGAIGYVTLATQERPFDAVRLHVNPVLAWGWILAVAAASIVWCLPQYSLANEVLSQHLLPGLFGAEGLVTRAGGERGSLLSMAVISVSILLLCTTITWSYDRGSRGLQLFERILKLLVALIVLCFICVVCALAVRGAIPWNQVAAGLVPAPEQFWRPATTFQPMLEQLDQPARAYWSELIVAKQREVTSAAVATAVGIHMIFLFPYSLLNRGWTREFRGLSLFDLSIGMLIPFVLVSGCVVVAAAAQFHAQPTPGFQVAQGELIPPPDLAENYHSLLIQRMLDQDAFLMKQLRGTPEVARAEMLQGHLEAFLSNTDLAEKKIAAVLISRSVRRLSGALTPHPGTSVADIFFSVGILGVAVTTISLLMLISGFVVCEIFGLPLGGWAHRAGTLLAGGVGAFAPYLWSDKAQLYLATPTSVFGLALLPFAYVIVLLMMNQPALLGRDLPQGVQRLVWNTLMIIATGIATAASLYLLCHKTQSALGSGWYGLCGVGVLLLLALIAQFTRAPTTD